jgi:pterin-4a-carbinolamine dehydratase
MEAKTALATGMDKPTVLTKKELATIMPRLSGWKLADNKLTRTFEFQDFVQSLSFVNSLVAYFETIDHHPDVRIIRRSDVRIDSLRCRRKGHRPRCGGGEEDLLRLQSALVTIAAASISDALSSQRVRPRWPRPRRRSLLVPGGPSSSRRSRHAWLDRLQ